MRSGITENKHQPNCKGADTAERRGIELNADCFRNGVGYLQAAEGEMEMPTLQREPRASWDTYGISRARYLELRAAARSGRYDDEARLAANEANTSIAQYILLSVMKNKSYERIEYLEGLGRIPCGRTDFYGYRRLFYHLLDEKLK